MAPVFSSMCCFGPFTTDRIILTGIITLASGFQLMIFARRVFFAREQYGVQYPAVTGNPSFERVYQAQQSILEWHPVFMTALWTSALFFNQVPSAICGLVYLISRHRYFNSCSRGEEERPQGFQMGSRALHVMGVLALVGLGRGVVRLVLSARPHGGWEEGFHPRLGARGISAGEK